MKYVLFNPHSCNGEGEKTASVYTNTLECEYKMLNMTEIDSYADFFGGLAADDEVIICGGDGTLNRFINDTDGMEITNPISYYPAGTGNDFYTDVKVNHPELPILITDYIKNLPAVNVNGSSYKFINGVGYGIDGYCCEMGDKLHAEGKSVDYTAIAIKGLLFHYKPTNATVIVDGKEYNYKKVWIAPTMNGRCYGGGMMPTPAQKRNGGELSVMIFHDTSSIQTLMIFPKIFKGEHVKKEKYVTVHTGKNITVKFDSPRSLQIDGETLVGIQEYTATI